MDKVFIDTDIILDVLAKREPHFKFAAHLLSLADTGKIKIGVSSLTFSNLNYMLSKQFGSAEARKVLVRFKTLVQVLTVNDKIIELALGSNFKDFEDAIQYYCAINNNYKTLLTRNLKDYKAAKIPVMTAESFLKK
jgi:predicted nucleic acid-binding protein